MNTWFRLYNEAVFDPKVQQLSPKIFKFWINLLCLASRNEGIFPPIADIMFTLRMTEPKTHAALGELYGAGLIDRTDKGLMPHNWNNRQFKSDGSTERVQRFRAKERNVSETLHETVSKQDQTQIQTRADTDSEQTIEKSLAISSPVESKYSDSFEQFWRQSTKRGSKVEAYREWKKLGMMPNAVDCIFAGMASWKNSDQWQDETKQPHICRWLKRRGWEEIVPKSNGHSNGNGQYRMPTTAEIDAAAAELRKQGAIK